MTMASLYDSMTRWNLAKYIVDLLIRAHSRQINSLNLVSGYNASLLIMHTTTMHEDQRSFIYFNFASQLVHIAINLGRRPI